MVLPPVGYLNTIFLTELYLTELPSRWEPVVAQDKEADATEANQTTTPYMINCSWLFSANEHAFDCKVEPALILLTADTMRKFPIMLFFTL